jgi:hypothetical protein
MVGIVPSTDDHMLADLRRQAESMSGPAGLPRDGDSEPIFDEPWQGRVVAMAIETVASLGLSWEVFRERLIAAIDVEPDRHYYASWLSALEDLIHNHDLATPDQIDSGRMAAASYRTTEQTHDDLEVFPVGADEKMLFEVLSDLFENHWQDITFGPLVQGAAYEFRAEAEPRLSMRDGYLTIDLGRSHFHLCIGEQRGPSARPVDAALARRRRCAHAELQRQWVDGAPRTWMFRLFNGDGEQQLTVLLPNPFLDAESQLLDPPDMSRLELWDALRLRLLSLPPDAADRQGTGFVHA